MFVSPDREAYAWCRRLPDNPSSAGLCVDASLELLASPWARLACGLVLLVRDVASWGLGRATVLWALGANVLLVAY